MLALLALLVAPACRGDDDDGSESPSPAPAIGSSTADRLRANAAEFDYRAGEHGGVLTVATISDPLTFNLAITNDASSSGVLGYLFEGLTEVSWLSDEVEPSLAESWEHSSDGLSWTFRLRTDVKWHDGAPFTAHDVEFTFNRIIYNDEIPTSSRAGFTFRFLDGEGVWQEAEMSVETIDDYTVRFVLPVSFAPFLRSMGTAIYPQHILERAVEDGVFAETWGIETDPAEVIGTGPFTIESYAPAERGPGAQPELLADRRRWRAAALPGLDRAGDRAGPGGGAGVVPVGGERRLRDSGEGVRRTGTAAGREELHDLPPRAAFGTTFLALHQNPGMNPVTGDPYVAPNKLGWFQNTQFRQAVSHAINRDAIIEDVFHGLGYPQWSSISPLGRRLPQSRRAAVPLRRGAGEQDPGRPRLDRRRRRRRS